MRQQFQAVVSFRVEIEPEGLELTADPELIEQVLINLLMNAFEATLGKAGRQVALGARLDGTDRVMLQVRDNGPGIVAEALDKIFIPFFTTKPDGSGIGLSLSRQVMRLHRGTIRVHSHPGVEMVFTLTFYP
jgi:two-component system nitrogen regulation sensor histidine kinase NtrY